MLFWPRRTFNTGSGNWRAAEMWLPSTEEELDEAIGEGLLVESHRLDFKREIPAGKSHNRKLACNLAQFAVDGGVLIIGVEESDDGLSVRPVDLNGLKERVDQVAQTIPDPPLFVFTAEIPAAGDDQKGYLLVEVPASPQAPHQVDGRFYGRGDTTRRVLSAAEVRRVLQTRNGQEDRIATKLDACIENCPVPEDRREHAHLHAVAIPLFAQAGMLYEAMNNDVQAGRGVPDPQFLLGVGALTNFTDSLDPDLTGASNGSRRADGWAFHTYAITSDGKLRDDFQETDGLDLEVTEDGHVRLFCGRATDRLEGGPEVAFEALILGLVKRLALVAANVGDQGGYQGPWGLGVAVRRLGGARSYHLTNYYRATTTPYSDEHHRHQIQATSQQLDQDVDGVVERLVGRLNRALNDGMYPIPSSS